MEIAELFHTVASAINIPNSSSSTKVKDDVVMDFQVKLAVLSADWDGNELEDFYRRVYFQEMRAQQNSPEL